MIGWLIAAGIVGAAIGSSASKDNTKKYYIQTSNPQRNYGSGVPVAHKRCNNCRNINTNVFVVGGNSAFVKLRFHCPYCGRVWYKQYRYN